MRYDMRPPGLKALAIVVVFLVFGVSRSTPAADDTLYHDLGEQAGISKIIDFALTAWASDSRISDQFDNVRFDWFKGRLVAQFCELTGGPCKYPGRDMHAAHKGLHLDTAQFNALVEDLQSAMDQAGIPFWTQNRLLALLAPMKRQIVTR